MAGLKPILAREIRSLLILKTQSCIQFQCLSTLARAIYVLTAFSSAEAFGFELPRIYRSAYYSGRGDTGIATADNHDSIFYNPAGLGIGTGIFKEFVIASPMIEMSEDSKNLARETAVQKDTDISTLRNHLGKPQHVGLYNFTGFVFRRAAIGAVSQETADVMIYKSKDSDALEAAEGQVIATNGAVFSVADTIFSPNVAIGATFKYLVRAQGKVSASVAEADSLKSMKKEDIAGIGTGAGADFGMMVRGSSRLEPSFGITATDIGSTRFLSNDSSKEISPLPMQVNAGVAVSPGTRSSKFRILADVHDIMGNTTTSYFKRLHAGAEITLLNIVGVTAGINQGYATGGGYVDFRFFRLDAGSYCEEVGERVGSRPDRRYFLALKFGF